MTAQLQTFLGPELSALWADGNKLIVSASGGFHDYSFVVFPFAKVYEGFLKKLLFAIGAIGEQQLISERWRVGRALNPELEKGLRHESVYDHIVSSCTNGKELADQLWQAWKWGRNEIFHYYPDHTKHLSFTEAREIVVRIEKAMEAALMGCKLNNQETRDKLQTNNQDTRNKRQGGE